MDSQREKISENHDNARDQSYSEKITSIKFHDTVTVKGYSEVHS